MRILLRRFRIAASFSNSGGCRPVSRDHQFNNSAAQVYPLIAPAAHSPLRVRVFSTRFSTRHSESSLRVVTRHCQLATRHSESPNHSQLAGVTVRQSETRTTTRHSPLTATRDSRPLATRRDSRLATPSRQTTVRDSAATPTVGVRRRVSHPCLAT